MPLQGVFRGLPNSLAPGSCIEDDDFLTEDYEAMPLRVKSRPQSQVEPPLRTPSPYGHRDDEELPEIADDDSFKELVKKLSM